MLRSALRFYEREGLIKATRTTGNQRRYERGVLRRLAFIRAARNVGLTLEEVRAALDSSPGRAGRRHAPTGPGCRTAGARRLDRQINALQALRDGLDSCIGCGCLSLKRCAMSNPDDVAAAAGAGAPVPPVTVAADTLLSAERSRPGLRGELLDDVGARATR